MLDDRRVKHGKCDETEADGYSRNGFEMNPPAVEKRVQSVLDHGADKYASYLIQSWHHVIWKAVCFHLLRLGNQVVLHLIKADIKNHEGNPGFSIIIRFQNGEGQLTGRDMPEARDEARRRTHCSTIPTCRDARVGN
jgi:hypothetical protein